MDMFNADGLEECWYESYADSCGDSWCNASLLYAGEWYNDTCENLETAFSDYLSNDTNCEEIVSSGDCSVFFDDANLEYCWYNSTFDSCTGEEYWCNATAYYGGEWYNDTCDYLESMLNSSSSDEDCYEMVDSGDCSGFFPEMADMIDYCYY
jgi:hypothetical protein